MKLRANSLKEIIENNENEIAAVILWPIHTPLGNKVEMPNDNFLEKVRDITSKKNIVLIAREKKDVINYEIHVKNVMKLVLALNMVMLSKMMMEHIPLQN